MKSLLIAIALWAAAAAAEAGDVRYGAPPPDLNDNLARLKEAYPDVIKTYDRTRLILKSGATIPVSDGRIDRSFDELLEDPDIDDMFAFDYPAGVNPVAPELDVDSGRIRVEKLFREIHGGCRRGEVTPKMRKVAWFGGSVLITTRNGADRALEAVARSRETAETDDEVSRSVGRHL